MSYPTCGPQHRLLQLQYAVQLDGTAEMEVSNAHYPLPTVTAGRSTKVEANAPGVEYDLDGSGFWTGPFELKG